MKELRKLIETIANVIRLNLMSLLFHASPFNAKQLQEHRYGLFVRYVNGKKIDSS